MGSTHDTCSLGKTDSHPGPLSPLAVIGMSFRYPQGAESEASFWDMIVSARNVSTATPGDRFNVSAHYRPSGPKGVIGTLSYEGGHFLNSQEHPISAFDAPFFSISATEAAAMNPVHRLTLETAYRALEDAGLGIEHVARSRTAVFAGASSIDYDTILTKDPMFMAKYHATGTTSNKMANRVSWFFDLVGPSGTVDAACSSSLMALDLACQSIWAGNATMALACGANMILTPESGMWLDNLNMLSPDSRCFPMDARANGFARGEGCGVLVFKPLSAAIADGDTIRAVIRATHSNSNGRMPGITQPSQDAQYRLIIDTYRKAGLDMGLTRFFEAHGTGTPLGDPAEFCAIGEAFGPYRTSMEPLYVGSVKSNIGHLEGGSGIAGVIKTILALEAGVIPPNANFETPNPVIDIEGLKIAMLKESIPWPLTPGGLRRASVQSFGFGGCNSHVILEDASGHLRHSGLRGNHNTITTNITNGSDSTSIRYPGQRTGDNASLLSVDDNLPKLLVWSFADKDGLSRSIERWKKSLTNHLSRMDSKQATQFVNNLAHTLGSRRSHLTWRVFNVAETIESVTSNLTMTGPFRTSSSGQSTGLHPGLAFIFTGQGSQWAGMGKELVRCYEVFRRSLVEANTYLRTLGCTWNIIEELEKEDKMSNINNPAFSQPLCTIIQVALVELMLSFGVSPVAVLGHSSGEIAAAFCAGAISRQSAWRLAWFRGTLAHRLSMQSKTNGAMMAVGISATQVSDHIKRAHQEGRITVACVNSPTSTTLSGDSVSIDALRTYLCDRGIFCRKLKVNVAYHSPQMREVADEYITSIGTLDCNGLGPLGDSHPGRHPVTMASSVTGKLVVTWDELRSPEYWVQNLVSPVLFLDGLNTLLSSIATLDVFVEIGPHSTLQAACRDSFQARLSDDGSRSSPTSFTYISVLTRRVPATTSICEATGRLFCLGYPLSISTVNRQNVDGAKTSLKSLTGLPAYAFNHTKTYWHESRISKGYRFRKFGWHSLLGVAEPDWNPLQARWRHIIRTSELPWVEDHQINGSIVYPAAGMFAMAIEGAKQLAMMTQGWGTASRKEVGKELKGFLLKDTTFHSVLKVPNGPHGIEVNLHMWPRGAPQRGGQEKALQSTSVETAGSWYDFCLYSCDSAVEEWQEKCRGSIQAVYHTLAPSEPAGHQASEVVKRHDGQLQRFAAGKSHCTNQVNPTEIYEDLKTSGYGYGLAFRTVTALSHNGSDGAVGTVETFCSDVDSYTPHVVHPATLDCIFQVTLMALVAAKKQPTAIPSHVERLWVANAGLSKASADSVRVFSTARRVGLRESETTLLALNQDENQVVAEAEGFVFTDVAGDREAHNESAAPKEEDMSGDGSPRLCHIIEWKPDLDLMSNDQVQSYCDQAPVPAGLQDSDQMGYYTDLEFLLNAFIHRTLSQVSETMELTIQSQYHTTKYLLWMRHRMAMLPGAYQPTPFWLARLGDADYVNQVSDRVLDTKRASARLYITVGSKLPQLLTGEIDPLDLLLNHGDRGELAQEGEQELPSSLAKAHYYEIWETMPSAFRLARYLDAIVHKNPNMRFIEIGAGTGATTRQILKSLAPSHTNCHVRCASYDYTDISPFFFSSAQRQFCGAGNNELEDILHFRKLDIEKDPETQGFDLGLYDVVVAGAVLHATSDLLQSLSHCRKLLKPGGKLILWEGTVPDALRTNFVFGLTEGWWLASSSPMSSSEVNDRHLSPHVDEDTWDELLKESGFSGNNLVMRDFETRLCHEFSIIVSTAVQKHGATVSGPLVSVVEKQEKGNKREIFSATTHAETSASIIIIHTPEQYALAEELERYMRTSAFGNDTDYSNASGSLPAVTLSTVESAASHIIPDSNTMLIFLIELQQRDIWRNMTPELLSHLQSLLTPAARGANTLKTLWISYRDDMCSSGAAMSMVDGVSRVLNSEFGDIGDSDENDTCTRSGSSYLFITLGLVPPQHISILPSSPGESLDHHLEDQSASSLSLPASLTESHMGSILKLTTQLASITPAVTLPDTEFIEDANMPSGGGLLIPRLVTHGALNEAIAEHTPGIKPKRVRLSYENEQLHESELLGRKPQQPEQVALRLKIGSPGLLDSLRFVQDKSYNDHLIFGTPLGDNEVEISPRSVGLNFKDVLVALGWIRGTTTLGCELAGVVTQLGEQSAEASGAGRDGLAIGDRVIALVGGNGEESGGAFRDRVRCHYRLVVKLPPLAPSTGIDSTTATSNVIANFSTASSIPVNFVTAYHSLHTVARLQPGDTVLIHSAAGGTGQAAVQVAKYLGAGAIFATVGPQSDKRVLPTERYGIPPENILSSRDTSSLTSAIMRLTGGRGVDVVLNSLSGDGLVASWECLAAHGRFVELGKRDMQDRGSLPLARFEKGISFSAVDISQLAANRPAVAGDALREVVKLLSDGKLSPVYPIQIFPASDIQTAFRTLQSGKTSGKIVVDFTAGDGTVEAMLENKPRLRLDADATYLIAGGLGGLGRNVAGWFVDRGARNLILLSRSGEHGGAKDRTEFTNRLRSRGVRIEAPPCNIADLDALKSVLDGLCSPTSCSSTATAPPMPAIKGCIQASMVLQDALFESMTFEAWEAPTASKVDGSWNLHTLLPQGLDFFVMFSSLAGVVGSRGQINYAVGNAFQDGLARHRISLGERATALDLGPFYDAGYLSSNSDLQRMWRRGLAESPLTQADLEGLLDYYCNVTLPTTTATNAKSFSPCQTPLVLRISGHDEQMARYYLSKPMFRLVSASTKSTQGSILKHSGGMEMENAAEAVSQSKIPTQMKRGLSLSHVLRISRSPGDALEAVTEGLAQKMATTLAVSRDELDIQTPVHRYGVDSLVAVELRSWLAREVRCDVAVMDFLGGGATISSISKMAVEKSRYFA
ncbi:putative polyketide synthase [Rhypophila decipiens]